MKKRNSKIEDKTINLNTLLQSNRWKIKKYHIAKLFNIILSVVLFLPSMVTSLINVPFKLLLKLTRFIEEMTIPTGILSFVIFSVQRFKQGGVTLDNLLRVEGIALLKSFAVIAIILILCHALTPLFSFISEWLEVPFILYADRTMYVADYKEYILNLKIENYHLSNIITQGITVASDNNDLIRLIQNDINAQNPKKTKKNYSKNTVKRGTKYAY